MPLNQRVRARVEPPQVEHQGRADLHGRSFAADRKAAEDGKERHEDLAEHDAERQQALAVFTRFGVQGGDHLRNTAPFRAAKEFTREPCAQRSDGWRHEQRQPDMPVLHGAELGVAEIDELGVEHRGEANDNGAEPEHTVLAPQAARASGDAGGERRECPHEVIAQAKREL